MPAKAGDATPTNPPATATPALTKDRRFKFRLVSVWDAGDEDDDVVVNA